MNTTLMVLLLKHMKDNDYPLHRLIYVAVFVNI